MTESHRRRRRRLLPKPPESPAGYVWFYWNLVPIAVVERRAKDIMEVFDRMPRWKRDLANSGDSY
jgi:hypothetical protein